MASTYKTPGVYVEEISLFPPSVAQVETAIPAFIGYTEKAEKSGEDLKNVPTEINSLLEFKQYFGGEYEIGSSDFNISVDPNNNYAVDKVYIFKYFHLYDCLRTFYDNGGGKCYIISVGLYTNSAGIILGSASASSGLLGGISKLENVDEPTMLVCPDAVRLKESEFNTVQQAMISQCAKLGDRVAILDLHENFKGDAPSSISTFNATDLDTAVDTFRDSIGINDLDYAAAYTPWIYSSYSRDISYDLFKDRIVDKNSTTTAISALSLSNNATLNNLIGDLDNLISDATLVENVSIKLPKTIDSKTTTVELAYRYLKNEVNKTTTAVNFRTAYLALVDFLRKVIIGDNADATKNENSIMAIKETTFTYSKLNTDFATITKDTNSGMPKYGVDYIAFEKNEDVRALISSTALSASDIEDKYKKTKHTYPTSDWGALPAMTTTIAASDFGSVTNATTDIATLKTAALKSFATLDVIVEGLIAIIEKIDATKDTYFTVNQTLLYQQHTVIYNIVKSIQKIYTMQPPSAAMAGVYCYVDNARGVWKAPANVSLASVLGPVTHINDEDQESLNVDVNAGKSINCIRKFSGKGTLVWGARTLDGNSKEWRYISVRRFFNMVEESIKKSTFPFVFEPNDANTWVKVKSMCENYLTLLWREGALAGAKAADAFEVACGLGITMTSDDILDGILNVEIKMAVVRPAEFIVLKFSHKMQES